MKAGRRSCSGLLLLPDPKKGISWATRGRKRWIAPSSSRYVTWASLALFVLNVADVEVPRHRHAGGAVPTAVLRVWTVHHDCDRSHSCRTLRSPIRASSRSTMFFHLEHHLYPEGAHLSISPGSRRGSTPRPRSSKEMQVF